jgi:hypothetical protein
VLLDRELERKAEMMLSEEKNEVRERRKAFRMGERSNIVPLCNIKSHFVRIDSGVLYGIMKGICPGFDVRKTEFSGETQETYWKNIFDIKRLKVSKKNKFTGMIETDGLAICVHYRRFKTDRHVPSSALPETKHEDEKEEDPAMQNVQKNGFFVGADPGNTNIVTIAVRRRAEDGTDGNLRRKEMRLLRFSRARYDRESGIMNARRKIETWNAGVKEHLEAMSEVTSREADLKAFRESMEVRVAHWEALWGAEYTKPRWARLRMNLYCGKQRAFANFFSMS